MEGGIENGANKSVASLKGATPRRSSCGSHRASSATLALDFFAMLVQNQLWLDVWLILAIKVALSDDRGLLEQAAGPDIEG
jgi:hypothetical protein